MGSGKVSVSIYAYLFISVSHSLSVHPRQFFMIIIVTRSCALCIRLQATDTNPFIVSVIFLPVCQSVYLSDHPRDFYDFVFVVISCVGVQSSDAFTGCINCHNMHPKSDSGVPSLI